MTEQPKKKKMPVWAIILVVVVAPFMVYMMYQSIKEDISKTKSVAESKTEIKLNATQLQAVQVLIEEGKVKRFPQTHFIYMDEDLWKYASSKDRSALTYTLSIWTTNLEGDDSYWGTIYGMYTDKKLAKWSQSFGYKEFD